MYDQDAYAKDKIKSLKRLAVICVLPGIACLAGTIYLAIVWFSFTLYIGPLIGMLASFSVASILGAVGAKQADAYKRRLAGIGSKGEREGIASSVDKMKTRLFGMIKSMKKIDIPSASEMLGMKPGVLKNLLFDLIGENKIAGEFTGDVFTITSEVDTFITALDTEFSTWGAKERSKDGKIE